jgi:hypothetical protein
MDGDVGFAEAQLGDAPQGLFEWVTSEAKRGTCDEHGMPPLHGAVPGDLPHQAPGGADYTRSTESRKEQSHRPFGLARIGSDGMMFGRDPLIKQTRRGKRPAQCHVFAALAILRLMLGAKRLREHCA